MQPPGVPQHIQIELARRELSSLKQQRTIAEQGIQALSNVAAELSNVNPDTITGVERAMCSGIMALVSLRLFELQTSHENLMARIPELEKGLAVADSRITIPGLHVKN